MRYFDNGSLFTVQCSRWDVRAFKLGWPCSGIPDVTIGFKFEKHNGDIVDIFCRCNTSEFDGPALLALSQDAQAYGQARLRKAGE